MTRPVRLVTLPSSHAYISAVLPRDVERVPPPTGEVEPWRPDPLWDPSTWDAVAGRVDVVHVHFGFDHVTPVELRRWVEVGHRHDVRLVLTVHDLRNPHHRDASVLDDQLAVLVRAADVVLTLTEGAATEVRRRYGRAATVVAHPAVFDGPGRVERQPGLVGVHLKSLRTNLGDVEQGVRAVADAVSAAGGRLEVDVHTDVVGTAGCTGLEELLTARGATLRVHDRFDDDALRRYLSRLSVSVQLHRWGTHSGWLEACHDVGTAVVAPDVGYLTEQWSAIHTYRTSIDRGPDPESLQAAVRAALSEPQPTPADRAWRRAQLATARHVHAVAYDR